MAPIEFIQEASDRIKEFLVPSDSLWVDWKLWTGIALVLFCNGTFLALLTYWPRRGDVRNLHLSQQLLVLSRTDSRVTNIANFLIGNLYLGVNLIFLTIWQYDNPETGTILLHAMVIFTILFAVGWSHVFSRILVGIAEADQQFTSSSVYGNFEIASSKIILTLVGQLIVAFFAGVGALANLHTDAEEFNYLFWLSSLPASQYFLFCADGKDWVGQLGGWYGMTAGQWETILLMKRPYMRCLSTGKTCKLSRLDIYLRWFADFTVNGVMVFFLIWAMPFVLALSETTQDFVFNLFALGFITTLDDSDEVTFDILDGLAVAESIELDDTDESESSVKSHQSF